MATIRSSSGEILATFDGNNQVSSPAGEHIGYVSGTTIYAADQFTQLGSVTSTGDVVDVSGRILGKASWDGRATDLQGNEVATSEGFVWPEGAGAIYWLVVEPRR